jgi:hypothetical protein
MKDRITREVVVRGAATLTTLATIVSVVGAGSKWW